jgi:opacity protein-like surface antigen
MFIRTLGALAISSCVIGPGLALAQERAPHTGSTAVGVDAGIFVPKQSAFDSAPVVNALFEYYVTPRVSLRTGFGFTNPEFNGSNDTLRQVPLRLDVNYNWERGKWHPFVGAGAGAYFLQNRNGNGDAIGETESKPGFNMGGGIEYFTGRTVSLKGEARYHVIGTTRSGQDPSGLVLTGGLKKYF